MSATMTFSSQALLDVAQAMRACSGELRDRSDAMRGEIAQLMSGWSLTTESRQAQAEFEQQLATDIEELCARLVRFAEAVEQVEADGQQAEVDVSGLLF